MRVVFAGTPDFAVPTLEALHRSRHELAGVLTQPDRPAGRHRRPRPSPVKQRALELGLPVEQPASLRGERADRGVLERLARWHPDVIVVAAYGLILPREVLDLPPFGCLNVHASLLPRWRGAAPVEHALLAGDEVTGVTLMRMDEGLDTGDILLARASPIGPEDTAGTVRERLARMGAELVLEGLEGLEQGTLQAHPQPAEGVTWAPRIEKEAARIDWARPARELERRIRALNPGLVAWTSYRPWRNEVQAAPERLRVWKARVETPEAHPAPASGHSGGMDSKPIRAAEPGTVLALEPDGIRVQTGEGVLTLETVQSEGGRPLPASEWLHARRLRPGDRLGETRG